MYLDFQNLEKFFNKGKSINSRKVGRKEIKLNQTKYIHDTSCLSHAHRPFMS